MDAHRYRVGDIVSYREPVAHGGERGAFQIEQLMPANAVENQYRVVRTGDGQRRIVGESELAVAGTADSRGDGRGDMA